MSFSQEIREGVVSHEIVKSADDCDLISMGKMGIHAEWRDVLGTNVEFVVRQTHKPVLITPAEYKPFTRMLIAYDGSIFADKALKSGAEIVAVMKLPITVVYVADKKTQSWNRYQRQRLFSKATILPLTPLQKKEPIMQRPSWNSVMMKTKNLIFSSWAPMVIQKFRK